MPIYQYKCEGGHREEHYRAIPERDAPTTCLVCGSPTEREPSLPALCRLEPIPMDRTGHRRRAAKRREKITGKPADLDYTSNSNNVPYAGKP